MKTHTLYLDEQTRRMLEPITANSAYLGNDAYLFTRPYVAKAKSVLMIGCGDGTLLAALAVKYPDVNYYGVDIDAGRVRAGARYHRNPKIRLIEGDARQLSSIESLRGLRFDVIILTGFLSFVAPETALSVLTELARFSVSERTVLLFAALGEQDDDWMLETRETFARYVRENDGAIVYQDFLKLLRYEDDSAKAIAGLKFLLEIGQSEALAHFLCQENLTLFSAASLIGLLEKFGFTINTKAYKDAYIHLFPNGAMKIIEGVAKWQSTNINGAA